MKSAPVTIKLSGVRIRVTFEQFRKLVQEGRVTADTPTWLDGRRVSPGDVELEFRRLETGADVRRFHSPMGGAYSDELFFTDESAFFTADGLEDAELPVPPGGLRNAESSEHAELQLEVAEKPSVGVPPSRRPRSRFYIKLRDSFLALPFVGIILCAVLILLFYARADGKLRQPKFVTEILEEKEIEEAREIAEKKAREEAEKRFREAERRARAPESKLGGMIDGDPLMHGVETFLKTYSPPDESKPGAKPLPRVSQGDYDSPYARRPLRVIEVGLDGIPESARFSSTLPKPIGGGSTRETADGQDATPSADARADSGLNPGPENANAKPAKTPAPKGGTSPANKTAGIHRKNKTKSVNTPRPIVVTTSRGLETALAHVAVSGGTVKLKPSARPYEIWNCCELLGDVTLESTTGNPSDVVVGFGIEPRKNLSGELLVRGGSLTIDGVECAFFFQTDKNGGSTMVRAEQGAKVVANNCFFNGNGLPNSCCVEAADAGAQIAFVGTRVKDFTVGGRARAYGSIEADGGSSFEDGRWGLIAENGGEVCVEGTAFRRLDRGCLFKFGSKGSAVRCVFEETAEASKAFSGFGSDVIAEENRAIR